MNRIRTLFIILLFALGGVAGPASAATISTTYRGQSDGWWSAEPAQFDPAQGTLTGVKIELNSIYSQSVDAYGSCGDDECNDRVYFNYTASIARTLTFGDSVLSASYSGSGSEHPVDIGWMVFELDAISSITVSGSALDYFIGTDTFFPRDRAVYNLSGSFSAPDDFSGYWSWSDSGFYDTLKITYSYTPAGAGAVPDASTWLLMLTGFGGIGLVLRRRRGGQFRSTRQIGSAQ
jgi:hypothetical protein